ncbi:cation efflux protein, CzcI-like [Acinetobacter sp. ANC5681]|uniref:cation efflux protein, CzcI-like n=1 Tax=Acinetobacter sp. ANC5681 TaxID=2929504 RepID=UPI0032DFE94E
MRRSAVFMTVLLSLFIFQSIWNVAAAYCTHENSTEQIISDSHFGHHFSESSTKNSSDAEVVLKVSDTSKSINVTDHHDHLPTCTNVVVLASEQQLNEPIFRAHELKQKYYWVDFYQSPYLSEFNPPPESTPLLVG